MATNHCPAEVRREPALPGSIPEVSPMPESCLQGTALGGLSGGGGPFSSWGASAGTLPVSKEPSMKNSRHRHCSAGFELLRVGSGNVISSVLLGDT